TLINTLSLHDALPILSPITYAQQPMDRLNDLMNSSTPQEITDEDEMRTYVKRVKESLDFTDRYHEAGISYKNKNGYTKQQFNDRSEEHTSELQSRENL